nr:steroid transmembrane transporter SLC22A24 [Gorilla gorilla gorilla]
MGFDVLLDQVGGMGRFQICLIAFFCITNILLFPNIVLENFTAFTPGHRCWVPLLDNDTVSDNDTGTLSKDDLLRISIPLDSNLRPQKCQRFIHPQWQLLQLNGTFPNTNEPDTEPCVDGWVYDRSSFLSTIVTEWDLVCESQSLKSMVQSLFMAGSLLGGLIYGHLSDRVGRKIICKLCFLQLAISNTCAAFAPTFLVYCILRFLAGFSTVTILGNTFILSLEWTLPRSRSMTIMVLLCSYSVGQMLLGGLAFAIQDWRILQLTVSTPIIVLFLSSWKMVESARWLIINNQLDEGLKELRRVAHINGKKNTEETLTTELVRSTMKKELDAVQIKTSVFALFHAPKLRMRVFGLCFVRFAITVPFYGLILNLQHLGSNVSLFQVLCGAVTLTARCVSLLTLNHMGRRISQMLFTFPVGLVILINTFLPQEMQILRVVLATLGIGSVSAASNSASVHHNELIPTILRSTVAGINAMSGRTGAALAPLLMTLMAYSPHLPWISYGVFPILAVPVILLLPETRDLPLPNTIQDVENDRKDSRNIKQEDTCMKVTQF